MKECTVYHETTPENAKKILVQGFSISYQNDYLNHVFCYIENHEITPTNNKGAKIEITISEDISEFFIFTEGFESNDHVPLAIPFEIINKYIKTFRMV